MRQQLIGQGLREMRDSGRFERADFSPNEVRRLLEDLFTPNPAIYWTDFLLSLGVGAVCFALVRWVPLFSLPQILLFVASSLLYYRAVLFIHELVHLRRGTFIGFRIVWNLLCGIPFLVPSFLYYTHLDHHRATHYGTDRDGEYLPLAHRPPRYLLLYLAESLVVPLLAVSRFLVLTPLTWFSPRLREFVYRRASSMVIDPRYLRPVPTRQTLRVLRLQEAACFLWCVGLLVAPPMFLGRWPIPFLVQAYLTAVFILTLNALRTLGAHRWTNEGGEMTFLEQTLDSLNYPRRPWITELWGPVGLRYHALHHLFPSLPYHALPEAHRRLMERLPADSPYRSIERVSLWRTLAELWHQARTHQSGGWDSLRSPVR